MSSIPTLRRRIFQLASLVLITLTMYQAWNLGSKKKASGAENSIASLTESYEEKVFTMQTKMIVGILEFFNQHKADYPKQTSTLGDISRGLLESFSDSLGPPGSPGESISALSRKPSTSLLQRELVISSYLNLNNSKEELCEHLEKFPGETTTSQLVTSTVMSLCESPNPRVELSDKQRAALVKTLGWFSDVFIHMTAVDKQDRENAKTRAISPAQRSLKTILVSIGLGTLLSIASLILFVTLITRLLGRKLEYRFAAKGMNPDYSLEVFCLYLSGMLLIQPLMKLLAELGIKTGFLIGNLICISLLSLLVLWPTLFSEKLEDVRARLGLQLFSIKRFFQDIALGPISYLGALIPLFIVLILYSFVLMELGVDPSSGAHPVVPIITSSKNPNTIYLIGFMAVILAPFIEEIMFRGALYSWLRVRCNAAPSIIISSVLFASVHPQGAVGVVPLTCIGMVLAFLREWRGSLVAPMLAHACFNAGTLGLVVWMFR